MRADDRRLDKTLRKFHSHRASRILCYQSSYHLLDGGQLCAIDARSARSLATAIAHEALLWNKIVMGCAFLDYWLVSVRKRLSRKIISSRVLLFFMGCDILSLRT